MLTAAEQLGPGPPSPLWLTIVLLYTAGVRRGEPLRRTLSDADSAQGVLHIRESKFHKSRFVPLSQDTHHELRVYLKQRLASLFSITPNSPLLCAAIPVA